jgi:hypothetical protein
VPNAWYHRRGRDRGWWLVDCHFDDRIPDGHTVAADTETAGLGDLGDLGDLDDSPRIWSTAVDPAGRLRVTVDDWAAPGAPACWFVLLVPEGRERASATLVAYPTGHLDPGTVVSDAVFFGLPVRSSAQIAAIRWWRDDGCVDQVFVGPEHRRTHLATKIVYAASAVHQAHAWPGRLHSDGRRTDLGQRLVAGLRHPDRIAPWTARMPPMDPD